MPYRVDFVVDPSAYAPHDNAANSAALVGCLTRINMVHLAGSRSTPSTAGLYLAPSVEVGGAPAWWKDVPTILRTRRGTRTDFLAWRMADQALRTGAIVLPVPPPPLQTKTTLQLDAFNGRQDAAASHTDLAAMLDTLVDIDTRFLASPRGEQAPNLYPSGVRYEEEPPGLELWQDVPTALRMRIADCEDLACWRVAELRVRYGVMARCFIIPQLQDSGSYLYHIVVQHPDGRIEDPSRALGMK